MTLQIQKMQKHLFQERKHGMTTMQQIVRAQSK